MNNFEVEEQSLQEIAYNSLVQRFPEEIASRASAIIIGAPETETENDETLTALSWFWANKVGNWYGN